MRVEAPKTIDQLYQLITEGMRCSMFAGSKTGELSINNTTVMLQDKIAGPSIPPSWESWGSYVCSETSRTRGDSVSDPIHTHFAADKY